MKTLRFTLVLAAAFFAALGGCSEDGVAPDVSPFSNTPAFRDIQVIGPSEIVFGIDVSDSVSAEELGAIVDGAAQCLADESLFPADGTVKVAVWAYGDTIAAVVADLTPVTASSVSDVFTPALQALTSDRMVTGDTAVLPEFLGAAGAVLAGGTSSDKQILVFGSGESTEGLDAACAALAEAGVLVSTIAVNADEAGEARFQACADATGGLAESVTDDGVGEACQAILKRLLVVDLVAAPETDTAFEGDEHMVMAQLFAGGDMEMGVSGVDVMFEVTGGPNAGDMGTVATDEDGKASFSWTGDGGLGTDSLKVSAAQPRTGAMLMEMVTVEWIPAPAPPECDAGGPYMATIEGDTVMVTLDASGSSDVNGDSLQFTWSVECEQTMIDDPTAEMPTLYVWGDCLCEESLMVGLQVVAAGDTVSCEASVEFEDMRETTVVVGGPIELWPPNHKLHSFGPEDFFQLDSDRCDGGAGFEDLVLVSATSNEPVNGLGDGNTEPDIVVDCPNGVMLRAERAGVGTTRVYTLTYALGQADGSSDTFEAVVYVPHDKGHAPDMSGMGEGHAVEGCGTDDGDDGDGGDGGDE